MTKKKRNPKVAQFVDKTVLDAAHIFAGSGVDTDGVAFVYEERNLNDVSGFESCRFGAAGCGVALNARFAESDLQFDKVFRLDAERTAVEGSDGANHVFFDEIQCVGNKFLRERNLFVSFFVHEVIKFAVVVKVLHFFPFDVSELEFIGRVESAFDNAAGNNVADFGANECCALARFNVLKINDGENASVLLESGAFSEIAC